MERAGDDVYSGYDKADERAVKRAGDDVYSGYDKANERAVKRAGEYTQGTVRSWSVGVMEYTQDTAMSTCEDMLLSNRCQSAASPLLSSEEEIRMSYAC